MVDIEKMIYDSFYYIKVTEELKSREREFGKAVDNLYQTFSKEQEKMFDDVIELKLDEEEMLEMKLIRFVLDIIRAIFGAPAQNVSSEIKGERDTI